MFPELPMPLQMGCGLMPIRWCTAGFLSLSLLPKHQFLYEFVTNEKSDGEGEIKFWSCL